MTPAYPKIYFFLSGILFLLIFCGCNKIFAGRFLANSPDCDITFNQENCAQNTAANFSRYDIFLIIGQSNTCSGRGIDTVLDREHPRIKQLGRHDGNDFKIIPATEPLDHHYRVPESIGFPMTFVRKYVCDLLAEDRNVLLIPAALNDTGFKDKRWRVGDDLYTDALFRVNKTLARYPGSTLKAILWQQGEKDVSNPQFTMHLDSMIVTLRKNIQQPGAEQIPFLLGGMVPYWVDRKRERQELEYLIKNTPKRIDHTAFADPREPCTIRKTNNNNDKIHYDATGQRKLGMRYYSAYLSLL